jgi:hypothetical protein
MFCVEYANADRPLDRRQLLLLSFAKLRSPTREGSPEKDPCKHSLRHSSKDASLAAE